MSKSSGIISKQFTSFLVFAAFISALACSNQPQATDFDPLPSWNEGVAKQQIIQFVEEVTNPDSSKYVSPEQRIATFDNDGTLWAEKPLYFQVLFAFDLVKEMVEADPSLKEKEPFRAILSGEKEAIAKFSHEDLLSGLIGTHVDMTNEEFVKKAEDWLGTEKHSRFNRLYTECVYQPMLELLDYLHENDFQTWICSGGGVEFMRIFSEEVYGIPPERVIGSSVEMEFKDTPQGPVFYRKAELNSFNDKEVKPVNILLHIGRQPILAFGNSDGDIEMLQYTARQDLPYLNLLLHHDDEEREYSYTKGTEKALELAEEHKWTVIYISKDFKVVFPFDKE
ncbi:MAG: haloacid dehalogenase-like hydrolase [Candidatus Aminicenantes bacterium]|nr:MAG: haloacid dehalogenase-like hydrolase [Candidatus Aminicenantes bacterium]